MKNALLLLLIMIGCTVHAADRELALAREMMEDALLRNDVEGTQLARERLLRIAAESDDRTVRRDAHSLAALSAMFESFSGLHDAAAIGRLAVLGTKYAERALEIDPKSADAWVLSGMLRNMAQRAGQPMPKDPEGAPPNRFAHAASLDPKAPAVAFFSAMFRSVNPNGAAPPEGVKLFDDLAAQLDADRAATGRRFGFWDAQAHAWRVLVRIAQDEPNAELLRSLANSLIKERPDYDFGKQLIDSVAERRFVAAPAVTWQPFLTDAPNDGKVAKHPDVLGVDRAESGDSLWYRVHFREPLPKSFGVNLVVNRSGDPATGMKWWGTGSTFRFDRLVTAWITRDGDRYFGRVGLTDEEGARGSKMLKIPVDIQLAMGADNRSVMIGVPRSALELTDSSTMIVAGGTHLVWNDDAASAANSR